MKKILLSLAFCIFITSNLFALNTTQIEEQIRYQVRDTTDTVNNPRWSEDILLKRINIVQDDIVAFTKCLKGRCLVTPIAEYGEYRLPNDLLTIDRVTYSISDSTTDHKRLTWMSLADLDIDKMTWEGIGSGLPREYYERRNYIGLYPKPSSTYATTKALKIDYWKKPEALSDDDDIPFDGDYSLYPYHDLIIIGVVIMCKKDEGSWQEVQVLQVEYAALLKSLHDYVLMRPDEQTIIREP